MYRSRYFNEVIKEICSENGIEYQELSDDWVIKLKKNNVIRFIIGYKFDLNTQSISELCNDKYALFTVLESEGLPSVKSQIIFKDELDKLEQCFNMYDQNVVIKPNNGTCGNNVLHITDLEELKIQYDRISKLYNSIDICPFYEIKNEYRIIYLNNKKFIYKKIRPIVIGDGIHSIKELLIEFNNSYFSKPDNFHNEKIDISYIPNSGEVIEYEWRFNLSKGAKIELVSESEQKYLNEIVNNIVNKLNLKFVSIDIIQNKDNNYMIMEINSGIMTENLIQQLENGRDIVKDLYSEAINQMFNSK